MGEQPANVRFEVQRYGAPGPTPSVSVSHLVPDADWFWWSLQWFCVPDCCGLDAYEFSTVSVRRALGHDVEVPDGILRPCGEVGDVQRLVEDLGRSAEELRAHDAPVVSASLINHFVTPAALADLFEFLALQLTEATP